MKKITALFNISVFAFSILSAVPVYADKTIDPERTGSVTIRYFDDVEEKSPVAGAEFTFYKIDSIMDYSSSSGSTGADGVLVIRNLELGKYRVVETKPADGHIASSSFILTLPVTEENEWVYDITIEPKAAQKLETTSKSVYSVTNTAAAQGGRKGEVLGYRASSVKTSDDMPAVELIVLAAASGILFSILSIVRKE